MSQKLKKLFKGRNNNYYIEDRKLGLIKLSEKNGSLLPVSSPTRNQLLIVIVEPASELLAENGGQEL